MSFAGGAGIGARKHRPAAAVILLSVSLEQSGAIRQNSWFVKPFKTRAKFFLLLPKDDFFAVA